MNVSSGIAAALFVAVALVACGDKKSDASKSKGLADGMAAIYAQNNAIPVESSGAVPKATPKAGLAKGDKNTPSENYVELNSGNQLMFSYVALMNIPYDHKEIAENYSVDYKRATDEFKKNDLLQALKPRIDAEIAKAKNSRYFKTSIDDPLNKYDFEKKGFMLSREIREPGYFQYFSDNSANKLMYTNGSAFEYLKITSDDDARKIEGIRSAGGYHSLKLMVYFFLQDADPSNKSIQAEILKVTLLDKKGNVLATQ